MEKYKTYISRNNYLSVGDDVFQKLHYVIATIVIVGLKWALQQK